MVLLFMTWSSEIDIDVQKNFKWNDWSLKHVVRFIFLGEANFIHIALFLGLFPLKKKMVSDFFWNSGSFRRGTSMDSVVGAPLDGGTDAAFSPLAHTVRALASLPQTIIVQSHWTSGFFFAFYSGHSAQSFPTPSLRTLLDMKEGFKVQPI